MISTILFDIDGTLLDSNDAHASSWADTFIEFGLSAEFEQIRRAIGMGSDHLLPALAGLEKESEQGKVITQRRGEIFREKYLPLLKPFPRARELVMALKNSGYKLIVATSSSKEDLKGLLERAKVDDLFEEKTNADDVESSKPDPDIVLAAMNKIGAKARETLMIGDTPYDIAAAGKANVRSIAFTCGGWSPDSLRDAIEIYRGPWDLLENINQSILAKNVNHLLRPPHSKSTQL